MKKLLQSAVSMVLVLAILLSSGLMVFAVNEGALLSFDVPDGDAHITAAVLVKNGVPYNLTEEEYIYLISKNAEQTEVNNALAPEVMNIQAAPRLTYNRFVVTGVQTSWDESKARRVSNVFERPAVLNVTNAVTVSRTVTTTVGAELSGSHKNIIDASISGSYNYSVSSSSSTEISVTGVLVPSGQYKYSAVVFVPNIATVYGNLEFRQEFQGVDSLLSTTPCVGRYAVKNGSYADGLYRVHEANDQSGFPALAGTV